MKEKKIEVNVSLDEEALTKDIMKYVKFDCVRNYSLKELEQKLINYLYEKINNKDAILKIEDIDLVKILFDFVK